ncbi:hypothetical protein QBC41DRAFT_331165 [Cercophora samala]|uniref:Zn(2)-C6 fungal-type domain-containing protein n=1 Tax=Cercophora samala TaxID=330535 RepID=A0AA40D4M4_9PEZI|nr:hypothetical protein QBC41DRAFT_331165 [Cercophora samala]
MFITLRSSGGGQAEGGGMEVVRRNSGPGVVKDRTRPMRRPACVACQTKKLRCTGSNPRNCDRCRARMVECVLPTSNGGRDKPRTNSSHSPQPTSSSGRPWQDVGNASPQRGDPPAGEGPNGIGPGCSKPTQQASLTAPRAQVGADPLVVDHDFFDCEFALVDPVDQAWAAGLTTAGNMAVDLIDGLDMDMDDFGRHSASGEVRSSISSSTNSGSNGTRQPNKSHQDSYNNNLDFYLSGEGPIPHAQPRPINHTAAQELPSMLALDTAPPLSPSQPWTLSGVQHPPNPNRPGSPPCSCLTDLVRVVQQLDDDEFHITTMSLDQVLRLQKWLVFQCCKPFDCPKCLDLSTIHTMRLILCDRLTEMFECIHLRIKRAGAILANNGSDTSSSQATPSPLADSSSSAQSHSSLGGAPQPQLTAAVGSGPLPAQLFCSSSGRAANTAACNPLMFSDEFRNQYSDEEQVHMIRVLLRLQSRNFQMLLARVERTGQVAASPARQTKVKSMMVRLAKATADIEGALRLVFQGLSIG